MATKEWERANREKRRAQRKAWGLANRDRLSANQRRYASSPKGKAKAAARAYKPEQKQAINKLNVAVYSGKTIPQSCENCGKEPFSEEGRRQVCAHHDDYARPYDVRWLCRSCHMKHHYAGG